METEIVRAGDRQVTLCYLTEPYELIDKPLWFHLAGRQQTASGYGAKLKSSQCVKLTSRKGQPLRRVYVTCWSNSGTAWIVLDGKRQILR